MKRNTFIIIILIIVMLCCSCCSYKETYANDNLYWTQNWNTNVLDKLNEILQEQRDSQNKIGRAHV